MWAAAAASPLPTELMRRATSVPCTEIPSISGLAPSETGPRTSRRIRIRVGDTSATLPPAGPGVGRIATGVGSPEFSAQNIFWSSNSTGSQGSPSFIFALASAASQACRLDLMLSGNGTGLKGSSETTAQSAIWRPPA